MFFFLAVDENQAPNRHGAQSPQTVPKSPFKLRSTQERLMRSTRTRLVADRTAPNASRVASMTIAQAVFTPPLNFRDTEIIEENSPSRMAKKYKEVRVKILLKYGTSSNE